MSAHERGREDAGVGRAGRRSGLPRPGAGGEECRHFVLCYIQAKSFFRAVPLQDRYSQTPVDDRCRLSRSGRPQGERMKPTDMAHAHRDVPLMVPALFGSTVLSDKRHDPLHKRLRLAAVRRQRRVRPRVLGPRHTTRRVQLTVRLGPTRHHLIGRAFAYERRQRQRLREEFGRAQPQRHGVGR
eukprot:6019633-Prymnesium_polylepis.1